MSKSDEPNQNFLGAFLIDGKNLVRCSHQLLSPEKPSFA